MKTSKETSSCKSREAVARDVPVIPTYLRFEQHINKPNHPFRNIEPFFRLPKCQIIGFFNRLKYA
jgi:hypothetical protein